jgi:hypothetical protein
MTDELTLAECGLRPGSLELVDLVVDYNNSANYTMPDVLEVEVHFGNVGCEPRYTADHFPDDPQIPPKRIQVNVERSGKRKLYLGGFRHRKTGLIYHHASSQTDFERRNKWEGVTEKFTRETQTVKAATRSQQTTREGGTQMVRPDLHIDDR